MNRSLPLLLALGLVAAASLSFGAGEILASTTNSSKISVDPLVTDILAKPTPSVGINPAGIGAGSEPVPEPATILALGAAGSLFFARKRRSRS